MSRHSIVSATGLLVFTENNNQRQKLANRPLGVLEVFVSLYLKTGFAGAMACHDPNRPLLKQVFIRHTGIQEQAWEELDGFNTC